MKMKWFIYISFPILVLLNLFDLFSTTYLINLGFEESNPFLNWLMNKIGVIPAMFIIKTLFIYILFEGCCLYFKKQEPTKRETFALASTFVILISAYSYFMYTKNFQYLLLALG